MTDFAVQIEELALGYDGNPALSAVSGSVHTGSLTAVVGPNGSGKSTLLKGIAGILQPLSGFCRIASGARIAYLPQLSELDRSFPASVRDLVSLGLWQDRGLLRWHRRDDRIRISQALAASAVSLLALTLLWRALIAECLDPLFLRAVSRLGSPVHFLFLTLVVINLVAGYQALGTLLSVGLMILPAVTARFWTRRVITLCLVSVLIGMVACISGLLFSYHYSLPSGPAIILANGVFYLTSTGVAMMKNARRRPHASLANSRPSRTE
ncbi:metal ABC transporter permease [Pectobacterium brasiliense]|uniref:metal ABC transporter permease n=1 Tax=Pectobacterium brasiliense TaxID=180957 RepID=UPI001F078F31|nr:metal ABC transporter permease [Pectobacterium brasiliense]